jgi:hypothetical protein
MALMDHFDRVYKPAQMAGQEVDSNLADIIPIDPSAQQEGFFDPTSKLKANQVVDYDVKAPLDLPFADAKVGLVTMHNGRKYEVVDAILDEPRSDKHVIVGTALGTSIHGHNWNTWLKMVGLEFGRVTLIGPEGGHAELPRTPAQVARFLHNLASISVRESAANAHEIVRYQQNKVGQQERELIQVGESRFAGIGIGINALASRFGHKIIYSDQIAPPFPTPKPLKPNRELAGRALEVCTQVASLGWHARSMSLAKARHYSRTVNPNPYFISHVVATVPTLVSGQVGRLAQSVPEDTRMYVTHFESDPWTNIEAWNGILSSFPNVVEDVREGDHGAIVKPENQLNRYLRLQSLRDELERVGGDSSRVNWNTVYMGGRLAVAA